MGYGYWPKYVPVAKRRAQAEKLLKSAKEKGKGLNPVVVEGRQIAQTFWGKAWCDHLENYSDYDNRLPRGRTYVRNGSVIDLQILKGKVQAQVMGSQLYRITIEIGAMNAQKWKSLVQSCAGKIDSLIELLQGKFSKAIMALMIDKDNGLFPRPEEISMRCSCPDYAGVCKHVAAVFYGIGARLDTQPESLFTLRHVDHLELIASATVGGIMAPATPGADAIEEGELSSLFGIEMAPVAAQPPPAPPEEKKQVSSPPKKKLGFLRPEDTVEMTVDQAAFLMKTSPRSLHKLLDDRKIPFRLEGGQKMIAFHELLEYRNKQGKK